MLSLFMISQQIAKHFSSSLLSAAKAIAKSARATSYSMENPIKTFN